MLRVFLLLVFLNLTLHSDVLFLSTPRSGTNLYTFSTTYFFCQPVWSHEENRIKNRLNLPVNYSLELLSRSHNPLPEYSKLIYIIRDHVENIVATRLPEQTDKSQLLKIFDAYKNKKIHSSSAKKGFSTKEELRSHIELYFKNLSFYHSFPGKKMIVYYEDLLDDPLHEMERFADFMGYDQEQVTAEKKEAFSEYLNANLQSYHRQHFRRSKLASKGKEKKYYSKKYSKHVIQRVNRIIKTAHPELMRYLGRYCVD